MNSESILKIFPEILDISDEKLRLKTLDAFAMGIEKGMWSEENIDKAPVTVSRKNCDVSLVEHIRDVTAVVMACYDILSKYYRRHGVEFSRDELLCGALLHDLGKFTEFALKNGKPAHSDNFQLMRHPLSGAILAAQAGLPDKVVHLIATHSFEGDRSYHTAESAFVRVLDDFVFKSSVSGLESL